MAYSYRLDSRCTAFFSARYPSLLTFRTIDYKSGLWRAQNLSVCKPKLTLKWGPLAAK